MKNITIILSRVGIVVGSFTIGFGLPPQFSTSTLIIGIAILTVSIFLRMKIK